VISEATLRPLLVLLRQRYGWLEEAISDLTVHGPCKESLVVGARLFNLEERLSELEKLVE